MGKLKFYGSEQPNHVQVVLIEFEFAVDVSLGVTDEDARDFIRAPRWLACSVPTPDDTMKDCEVEEEKENSIKLIPLKGKAIRGVMLRDVADFLSRSPNARSKVVNPISSPPLTRSESPYFQANSPQLLQTLLSTIKTNGTSHHPATTATSSSSSFVTPRHLQPRHTSTEIVSPPSHPPAPPPAPETYIIQLPKDQIYRIPPSENASIIDRHTADLDSKHIRRGSPCINCSCWLLRILLLLGIVTLLSGVIFFLTVRPSVPTFNIARVVANTTRYKFMMMSRNKSLRMGFYYQRDGNVVLAYKSAEIAGGNTPEFYHGYKSVKEFEIVADGLKRALPKEVKRSLNGSREALPLTVSARFPVKLKVGSLRLWRMRMRILCDVKVRSLGKRTHVLSEKCKPKLRV
ncbi:NDR1/HIN1-like protein 13 [Asparagus officinalis]|uniref:NDR1/HIN1-like protein 13 n=1 Tax=Asparagus officinalis TaxID=4686 RepID=UPI00098E0F72|nr:NDR1/HIN1-like protein 13 [Asparagus officinalis]